jgi:omega-3 fatty acid desaturase (delta-15 desaturase)
MVVTSDICLAVMYAALAAAMVVFGPGPVARLYWVPYLVFVVWLDTVTYLVRRGVTHGVW